MTMGFDQRMYLRDPYFEMINVNPLGLVLQLLIYRGLRVRQWKLFPNW